MTSNNTFKRLFVDTDLCLGCKTCELRCAVERSSINKNLFKSVKEEPLPRSRVYLQWDGENAYPLQCRHCADAKCLEICSTGAIKRDKETGCIYHEPDRCISCWMCVMVCPYGVIAAASEKKSADKCDQCFQMAEPYCLAACPTGALQLMTPDEYNELLSKKRGNNRKKL
jgi:carbon-monoxide dehydrogenase iron sulfur subunit